MTNIAGVHGSTARMERSGNAHPGVDVSQTVNNSDILKKFRDFSEGGTRAELTSSLDSLEKTLYTQFYGSKREKLEKKRKTKSKEKKVDIETLIAGFLNDRGPLDKFKTLNIVDLHRISKYLSEFQQIKHLRKHLKKEKVVETSKIKGISWNNQQITQILSETAKEKRDDSRSQWTGAGSYVPNETKRVKTIRKEGVGIGKRFSCRESITPGPGTYGTNKNFHITEKQWKKPTTLVPSFDWSPSQGGDIIQDRLPPNTYHIENNKSIYETVNKRVTKRGPYDTFTGPRDITTIKNHFSSPPTTSNKSWPMNFPGMVDELYGKAAKHKGRWLTSKREVQKHVKIVSQPGPNHYQSIKFRSFKQNKYGFNCSTPWLWSGPLRTLPLPGPGRYNPFPEKTKREVMLYEKGIKINLKNLQERTGATE